MFKGYLRKKTILDAAVLFVCLGIVLLLAKLYHPDNLAMYKISPHPFFIISIVYSAYHGLRFSILSSIATALLYYALLAYQVDFEEVESIFTGAYLVLPLTTTIVSIVIGDIRQRTWGRQQEIQKSLEDAQGYTELLKKEKKDLEVELKEIKSRLVTKTETTRSLYHRARGFYDFQRNNLFIAFQKSLAEDCSVEESQLYFVNEADDSFSLWSGEDEDRVKAVEEKKTSSELVTILKEVKETGEAFSIRDLILKNGFDFKKSPCLVAAPIFNDGEVFAVIVVSKIPFLKLTPTNLTVLNMLCEWLGDAIFFSERYHSLSNASLISRENFIHRGDYFLTRYDESLAFRKKFKTNLSTIEIKWTSGGFRASELIAFKSLLAKSLGFLFEGLEFIGEGENDHSLRILLFRSKSESEVFLSELREELTKIKEYSGLQKFPELFFTYVNGFEDKESSLQ